MDKAEILASLARPTGTSKLGDIDVDIRGMTTAQEIKYSGDGIQSYVENAPEILADCITGPCKFSAKELEAMRSGVLKTVLLDVLKVSFPAETTKN
jgi:hypothetical protein